MDYKTLISQIKSDDPRYSYYVAGNCVIKPQGGYKIAIPKGTTRINVIYHCAQEYAVGYVARAMGEPVGDYSTLCLRNWYSSPFKKFGTGTIIDTFNEDWPTRNHGGMGVVLSEYRRDPLPDGYWFFIKPVIGYGLIYDLQVDFFIDKKSYAQFDEKKAVVVKRAPGGVFAVEPPADAPVEAVPSAPSRSLSAEEITEVLAQANAAAEKVEARKGVIGSFLNLFKGPRRK